MAFGSSSKGYGEAPREVRADAEPGAREPEPDRSSESWGAWGPNQIAQPDPEKSLMDEIEVAGPAQRGARSGAEAAAVNELPNELDNPTARDFRAEEDDTDEVRMATEAPRNALR
jgi:hypothetical protein